MYKIYPKVLEIKYGVNCFPRPKKLSTFFEEKRVNAFIKLKSFFEVEEKEKNKANLLFLVNKDLEQEEYVIEIKDGKIMIYSSTDNGAFYGVLSLYFIMKEEELIEAYIHDKPDLSIRGLTYDISRNKVPKVETVLSLIDMIALLKYNHFELYVEGLSFEYEKYKKYLKEDNYITKKEYKEIEEYANKNFIDLVPNENGFGHMGDWLAIDEFKDLAECPEGIDLWGRHRPPTTLDPSDLGSIEFVKDLYSEMIPLSNSKYFNMNFDEPFELGKGKSKELVEKEGIGKVYIDYTLKAVSEIKKYNKTPLIWMDVLIKHGDLLHLLPKDMIFMDWGYDALSPFDRNLKLLKGLNTKFISAPGTSSWCSFLGRTDAAIENINNAINASIKYNALGSVLTDWGDFGHLQFLEASFPEIVYFGLASWRNCEGNFLRSREYLNDEVFKDKNKIIGNLIFELGRYNNYENHHQSNGTEAFYTFMWSYYASIDSDPINYFKKKTKDYWLDNYHYKMVTNFFKEKLKELDMCSLGCEDGSVSIKGMKENIKLILAIYKLQRVYNSNLSKDKKIKLLDEILELDYVNERKALWLHLNKISDFEISIAKVKGFIEFVKITRENLRGGTL